MEVRKSKIRNAGLGVFATRNYKKDELIERSGYILVTEPPDDIKSHCFDSGDPKKNIVYFGKMTLINHATNENVYYTDCTLCNRILEFNAKTKISTGQEFLIDYGFEEDENPF